MFVLVLFGLGRMVAGVGSDPESGTDETSANNNTTATDSSVSTAIRAGAACTDPEAIAAMDPRAKLAQLLMVGVGEDAVSSGRAAELIEDDGVGGVFLTATATTKVDPDVLADANLAALETPGGIPPLVGADVEGGAVRRIGRLPELEPAIELALSTPDQIQRRAEAVGGDLTGVGVNTDFAPVVDIGTGSIGGAEGRTFGDTAEVVTEKAGAFAAGLRDAGVLPVFKHFPGHGRVDGDPHVAVVTGPSLAELQQSDLIPYETLLDEDPSAVMIGHQIVPDLSDGLPASMSPAVVDHLRGPLGFDGLVISDELALMTAAAAQGTTADNVLAAVSAGIDVALFGGPIDNDEVGSVLDRLEQAVESGDYDEVSLDESVGRVLAAKRFTSGTPC